MLIEIIKSIHLLLTLSLIAAIVYCLVLVVSKKFVLNNAYQQQKIHQLNRTILTLATLAILTGTFLVYPRHFTFHTLWIQVAYILLTLFTSTVGLLVWLSKKQIWLSSRVLIGVYFVLGLLLVVAVHDAVAKAPLFV